MTDGEQQRQVEPSRFPLRPVLIFGIGVVVSIGIVYVISALMMTAAGEPDEEVRSEGTPWMMEDPADVPTDPEDWPPPLQPDPETDYEVMRARQLDRLESYGWVDREREIAHIPIDDAMDLVLQDEPIARDGAAGGGASED